MFTSDDLVAINDALASGELTVKINGREITYRSISELQKSRRLILRSIRSQSGVASNPLAGITTHVNRRI